MWEPVLQTLSGGLIALFGGFGSQWVAHKRDKARARKAVAAGLAAEIGGLCAIARRRRYLDEAKATLAWVRANQQPFPFKLNVKDDYMTIFKANAATLGNLPPELAGNVVKFYVQVKSLLEDTRSDAPEPATFQNSERMLQENVQLLGDTLDLGDSLVKRLQAEAL